MKNLPDYMEEVGAEVTCAQCAGTAEKLDSQPIVIDRLRSLRAFTVSGEELEVAA